MTKKAAPSESNFDQDMSMSPGDFLKQERLRQKKTLSAISTALCINKAYLASIEEMELNNLPERVYTLGFVNTYALYLGLDPTSVMARFSPYLTMETPSYSSLNHEISPKIRPKWYHFATALALLILAFGLWEIFSVTAPTPSPDAPAVATAAPVAISQKVIPPVSVEETPYSEVSIDETPQSSSVAEQRVTPADFPMTSQSPLTDKTPYTFKASEKVWLEVRDDDHKVILTKTLLPGEVYVYEPKTRSTLTTGNAGGLEIKQGTRKFKPLGKTGEVKRHIPLPLNSQESETEELLLSLT